MGNKILILQTPSEIENLESTYHFIIDFMKMNFTDFLYNVFILKRYEAKACEKRNRKRNGQSVQPLKPDPPDAPVREKRGRIQIWADIVFLKAERWWNRSLDWADEGGNRTAEKHKAC